jgi:hypothetical protein
LIIGTDVTVDRCDSSVKILTPSMEEHGKRAGSEFESYQIALEF